MPKLAPAKATTRSPGASAVTPAPAAATTPAFHAERRAGEAALERLVAELADGVHDVAEIEAGGAHLDLDFVVGERAQRPAHPAEVLQLSRAPRFQGSWFPRASVRLAPAVARVAARPREPRSARSGSGSASSSESGCSITSARLAAILGSVFRYGEVRKPKPEAGILVARSAHEAPDRRVAAVRRLAQVRRTSSGRSAVAALAVTIHVAVSVPSALQAANSLPSDSHRSTCRSRTSRGARLRGSRSSIDRSTMPARFPCSARASARTTPHAGAEDPSRSRSATVWLRCRSSPRRRSASARRFGRRRQRRCSHAPCAAIPSFGALTWRSAGCEQEDGPARTPGTSSMIDRVPGWRASAACQTRADGTLGRARAGIVRRLILGEELVCQRTARRRGLPAAPAAPPSAMACRADCQRLARGRRADASPSSTITMSAGSSVAGQLGRVANDAAIERFRRRAACWPAQGGSQIASTLQARRGQNRDARHIGRAGIAARSRRPASRASSRVRLRIRPAPPECSGPAGAPARSAKCMPSVRATGFRSE